MTATDPTTPTGKPPERRARHIPKHAKPGGPLGLASRTSADTRPLPLPRMSRLPVRTLLAVIAAVLAVPAACVLRPEPAATGGAMGAPGPSAPSERAIAVPGASATVMTGARGVMTVPRRRPARDTATPTPPPSPSPKAERQATARARPTTPPAAPPPPASTPEPTPTPTPAEETP